MPALFALTLLVTFPSLYVFDTLLGPRLRLGVPVRLGVGALSVLTAVLSAFGPITAFFSVTTTNYPFVVLLNVASVTAQGVLRRYYAPWSPRTAGTWRRRGAG